MHVILDTVSKTYPAPRTGAWARLVFQSILGRRIQPLSVDSIVAINNLSISAAPGERIGLVGRNGAGKSTLLQLIAGLAAPTSGRISTEGKVTCVMTLGVALRDEVSGRENIYIDGEANGKTIAEIEAAIPQIAEFSELGRFLDLPVRTYSSGMKSRLAFSMITSIHPEILLLDETLSVGDLDFSRKSAKRIHELCDRGAIVFLVSHSMGSIVEMCNRCLWLDNGELRADGSPAEVTSRYLDYLYSADDWVRLNSCVAPASCGTNGSVRIDGLGLRDERGRIRRTYRYDENPIAFVEVTPCQPMGSVDLRISVERADGILVTSNFATSDGLACGALVETSRYEIALGALRLSRGTYFITIDVLDSERKVLATAQTTMQIDNPHYYMMTPPSHYPAAWEFSQKSAEIGV